MPFNMKQYLDGLVKAGAMSDEQRKALELVFKDDNQGLVKYLEDNQRMQSDYSRSMDEIKAEREQLQSLKDQLISTQTELAKQQPGWSAEKQRLLAESADLKGRIAQMKIKAESKYDVTEEFMKDIFGEGDTSLGSPAQVAAASAGVQFDPAEHLKGYVREEQVNTRAAEVLRFNTYLMKKQRHHHALFNDYFDEEQFLDAIAKNPTKPYDAVYEELYHAADRQRELQEQQIQQRIEAGIREGVQRTMLGQTMEGAHRADNAIQSQVFVPQSDAASGNASAQPDTAHLSRSLELWDKVDEATGGA